jgi:hypothetical protein
MHISDFHSKLTSMNDEGHLFAALRSLSLVENPQAMFNAAADDTVMGEWITWPPMDAHGSCAAAASV